MDGVNAAAAGHLDALPHPSSVARGGAKGGRATGLQLVASYLRQTVRVGSWPENHGPACTAVGLALSRYRQPMVRLLPEDEIRRRARAITALHEEWAARQLAKGVDGPVPDDRPEGSDYNQHFPAMEASAEDQDEYFARLAEILDGSPAA